MANFQKKQNFKNIYLNINASKLEKKKKFKNALGRKTRISYLDFRITF